MKELSIKEKAERYDEALKRANEILHERNANSYEIACCEYIFNELKESDDDRIRKEIIDFIKSKGGFKGDWVAWLEKQGKQKLVTCPICGWKIEKQGERRSKLVDFDLNANDSDLQEVTYFIPNGFYAEIIGDKVVIKKGKQKPKFRVGDIIKCKYDDRQFIIKSVDLDKGTYTYTQGGCGNDIDYADEEFELVEPKPAEWSEEDKDMLGILLKMINFASDHYQHDDKATDIKAWVLKSPKDRVQLKQEWSEEDEKKLSTTIAYLLDVQDFKLNAKKCINWLKELKNRVLPQPTKEWNEKDEMQLDAAIQIVNSTGHVGTAGWLNLLRGRIYPKQGWSEEDARSIRDTIFYLKSAKKYFEKDDDILWDEKWFNLCIEWLESLYKKLPSKSQWEPSDEQMDALETAISSLQSTSLESLYNELKKL